MINITKSAFSTSRRDKDSEVHTESQQKSTASIPGKSIQQKQSATTGKNDQVEAKPPIVQSTHRTDLLRKGYAFNLTSLK